MGRAVEVWSRSHARKCPCVRWRQDALYTTCPSGDTRYNAPRPNSFACPSSHQRSFHSALFLSAPLSTALVAQWKTQMMRRAGASLDASASRRTSCRLGPRSANATTRKTRTWKWTMLRRPTLTMSLNQMRRKYANNVAANALLRPSQRLPPRRGASPMDPQASLCALRPSVRAKQRRALELLSRQSL